MKSSQKKIKLTQVLAKKLSILTVAIACLISLATPTTYYAIESRSLKKTTKLYAEDIADDFRSFSHNDARLWQYQQPEFELIISYFAPKKELVSIEILDEENQNIRGYEYQNPDLKNWKKNYFTVGHAPILFNNRTLGTVRVTSSQAELILTTLWLFLFSSAIGISLAFLVYCFPLNISSRQELQIQKLFHEIEYYDGLTGLPNRRFFLEKLNKLFELCRKSQGEMFAVLFIDLDSFKKINDSLGHLAGDELLIAFSRTLKQSIRREDILARLGGDEFAILVENIQELSDAISLADRIAQKLEKPLKFRERELFISASIGIAPSTNNYHQVGDLLRDADTAMYRAKATGKGRHTVFQPEMYLEAVSTLELEHDLRRAVERREFQVFYQPIVKLSNRQIVGFEALVRWQHPEKGMVSPGKFIPIAEETGLIVPLGYQVMEQACLQMRQWQDKYGVAQTMTLSVNVSPVQLKQLNPNNPYCFGKIRTIVEKTGLDPHCLKLEITESTIMESLEVASSVIENLKTLGIKLSMDDFGTGYSSLNYLHKLPLDTLKIDRSFVNELGIDSEKLSLTQTIVCLAQNLSMDVIAEGVETKEQQAILTELNCEYGQGYLFSKPVSSADAEILIATIEQSNSPSTG